MPAMFNDVAFRLLTALGWGSHDHGKNSRGDSESTVLSYILFVICAGVVFYGLSDGVSSLLSLSAGMQMLGFFLLVLKVQCQGGVSGISSKMLGMFTVTLVLRLSCTLQFHGYLPADHTGDWLYQCVELLSLFCAAWLLYKVTHVRRVTFMGESQNDQDSMPGLHWIMLVCIALAVACHCDMNRNKFYDTVWACACYIESVAMLPQLWMMTKAGGEVEALTGHFVVLTAIARFLSLCFWYLDCEDFVWHFIRHPSFDIYPEQVVIAAHILQLILSFDFVVLYAKSFGKNILIDRAVHSQWI